MTVALIIIFVLVYLAIALEEPLKINKSAAALAGAGLLWTVYAMASGDAAIADEQLNESLINTAQIAFFLMGAMTVVEVVDAHDGFAVITSRLRARTLATLVIFLCVVTFFLSAVLDNLTTTIVMVSLLRRLLRHREDRLVMAGMIVISANAGGAWSPIGDVTTTMLWIGGQVTTVPIVTRLIVPSLVNMLVPLAIVAWTLRGKPIVAPEPVSDPCEVPSDSTSFERNLMFTLGLVALLSVPAFKAVTHLPPFLGILFGLGILWAIGDLVHRDKDHSQRERVTIAHALRRIDMSAIVFFIGILLAVATLEHAGVLAGLARWLDAEIGRLDVIVVAFGLLSAIVDNVPMVAAAIGMYDIGAHPPDSFLWEFMAYCAGTGGSILIIGSAAGVAAMGAEKIDFIWYLRRFGGLALVGYFAGALVYILQTNLIS
uniref:sodium:proton antiporter NhaD n=1 Tax=Altererythrobacter segetis TaxID=1104773 RepID=UPI0014090CC2|nr:sodium:proton antiporter NhaD [Altererythrobacter segetis]